MTSPSLQTRNAPTNRGGVPIWRPDHRPCHRCGLVRECRKQAVLCRDCKDTLTPEEKRAWR